jgi:hypothetical protein
VTHVKKHNDKVAKRNFAFVGQNWVKLCVQEI